jgi:hypothetical protein
LRGRSGGRHKGQRLRVAATSASVTRRVCGG